MISGFPLVCEQALCGILEGSGAKIAKCCLETPEVEFFLVRQCCDLTELQLRQNWTGAKALEKRYLRSAFGADVCSESALVARE